MRRAWAQAGVILGAAVVVPAVLAQGPPTGAADAYPTKPVRVIVGLAPGGGADILARMLSQKLSENLRRSFVVENRTGAGGTLADALVARSAPDGYTVLAVASSFSITPAIFLKIPYDPIKDFVPVSLVVQAPILLLAHPSLPVKSVKELIALAKSRPGALDAASAGHGSSNHMALELFNSLTGLKIAHIPYKGAGPALIDLMAGQVHMLFANIVSSLGYVRNGKLRALAVTSARRSPAVPELPTVAESVPGYETTTWHGWLAPAGTPAEVVTKLNVELARAVKSRDVAERLADDGGEPVGSTPEQFSQHLAGEIARWRKVVKEAGVRVE